MQAILRLLLRKIHLLSKGGEKAPFEGSCHEVTEGCSWIKSTYISAIIRLAMFGASFKNEVWL